MRVVSLHRGVREGETLLSAGYGCSGAAPVMIATASGIEWVCGVTTATRRPSRMIWMRSASSKTLRHVVADQDHGQAALADAADQVEHLAASP